MPCRDFGIENIERVHFIGVGGVGMSGIASVAAKQGMKVSGSDLKESKYSKLLRQDGVEVFVGHDAANVENTRPDVVVASTAIPQNNPELVAAKAAGIPVWPRAKMLAYVCRGLKVIAAAGTHGKTTTSSMAASALMTLDADPSFLVGGILDGYNGNARYGEGQWCVIEADESDGSFVYLDPYIAIITNIEADHLDHYSGIDEIREAFASFIAETPEGGCVIACADCEGVPEVARSCGKAKVILYGQSDGADVKVSPCGDGSFEVEMPDGQKATAKLAANPGVHNMLNAAAVLAALVEAGFGLEESVRAVEKFSGVRRRFDKVGEARGVTVVDDYGHHPTEIAATIAAAASMGYKRVHVLFQPHRYSRTQMLANEFGPAFDGADEVTVMDVYSAGETPIPGVTGKTVADAILAHDPSKKVSWVQGRSEVVRHLLDNLSAGDLLITMGAGDVTQIGPRVVEALENEAE